MRKLLVAFPRVLLAILMVIFIISIAPGVIGLIIASWVNDKFDVFEYGKED